MAIESIQLKLSNLEYLNKDESILLFDAIFTNKLTQLEFNNLLNSLNSRGYNNLDDFSCLELQGLYFYLDSKMKLNYVTVSDRNTLTPNYYTLISSINTPFNSDLFTGLIMSAYFTFKQETAKFSLYDVKYSNNSCKNDYYNVIDSTVLYKNFSVINNPLSFFNSYVSFLSRYNGRDALKPYLNFFKTYITQFPLKKYVISNSIELKNYLSNSFDSNIVFLNSQNKIFEITNTSTFESIVNFKWTPTTLTTTHSFVETDFDFSQDYNSIIMRGLSKDYLIDNTVDLGTSYSVMLASVLLSDIYKLSLDVVYNDIINNMLKTNKVKEYIETGNIV